MFSSNYPGPGILDTQSKVVHYYCMEWVKMGLDVVVVHVPAVFPLCIYPILRIAKRFFVSRVGFDYASQRIEDGVFEMDGVLVIRFGVFKTLPRVSFSRKELNNVFSKISSKLKDIGFSPEVVLAHWLTPGLYLLSKFKTYLPNEVRTALVVHEGIDLIERDYRDRAADMLRCVDVFGFRSNVICKNFSMKYNAFVKSSFICRSGIDVDSICMQRDFSIPSVFRVSFVGTLIKRKHPDKVIEGASHLLRRGRCKLSFIGDGVMLGKLKRMVARSNFSCCVEFLGWQKRAFVLEYLKSVDVLVLISSGEAFGLVCIEALAKGCIVIVSRNEGMDGIVVNEINGFLCNAGDSDELTKILNRIAAMTDSESGNIRMNAIKTAKALTSETVAQSFE